MKLLLYCLFMGAFLYFVCHGNGIPFTIDYVIPGFIMLGIGSISIIKNDTYE